MLVLQLYFDFIFRHVLIKYNHETRDCPELLSVDVYHVYLGQFLYILKKICIEIVVQVMSRQNVP